MHKTYKLIKTGGDNVAWEVPPTRGLNGRGFISEEGSIYLTRCPSCGLENYAMTVASGQCAWCGFDANKNEEKE